MLDTGIMHSKRSISVLNKVNFLVQNVFKKYIFSSSLRKRFKILGNKRTQLNTGEGDRFNVTLMISAQKPFSC